MTGYHDGGKIYDDEFWFGSSVHIKFSFRFSPLMAYLLERHLDRIIELIQHKCAEEEAS